MSRNRRTPSSNGIYHVMLRGVNRQRIFECNDDYMKFIMILHDLIAPHDQLKGALPPRCAFYTLLPHAQPCPSAPSRKRREYIHEKSRESPRARNVLQQQVRTFRPSLSGQIQKRARREVFIFPNTHPLHPPESSSRQTVQQCRRLRLEQLARIHRLAQPYVLDLLRISRPEKIPLDDPDDTGQYPFAQDPTSTRLRQIPRFCTRRRPDRFP